MSYEDLVTKCPRCGNSIAAPDLRCPECGYPQWGTSAEHDDPKNLPKHDPYADRHDGPFTGFGWIRGIVFGAALVITLVVGVIEALDSWLSKLWGGFFDSSAEWLLFYAALRPLGSRAALMVALRHASQLPGSYEA